MSRFYYYRDFYLLFSIIKTSFRISRSLALNGSPFKSRPVVRKSLFASPCSREKIVRYCLFWLRLRAMCKRRSSCLLQAALIWRMLAYYGHDAKLYFGVDKRGNELVGHTWVEWKGARRADNGYKVIGVFS